MSNGYSRASLFEDFMKDVKEYLGDGAYVTFDGYHIVLTAENGIFTTDKVCLEPEVLQRFSDYVERLKSSFLPSGKESLKTSTEPA